MSWFTDWARRPADDITVTGHGAVWAFDHIPQTQLWRRQAMTGWRPRVVRNSRGEDTFLVIVDVLHGADKPHPSSISAEVAGDDLSELRERLEQMLACLGEPIIEAKAPANE